MRLTDLKYGWKTTPTKAGSRTLLLLTLATLALVLLGREANDVY